MDTSRASEILNSIDLTSPNATTKPSRTPHRIYKQRPKPISTNPTIKYFQSISRRRISSPSPQKAAITGESTYLPFNKSALVSRIQTFQKYTNWNITSSILTPLIASRHGWSCFLKNELRCVSCGSRLSVKIPQGLSEEDEDEILTKVFEKYVEQLIDGHKESCAWRKQWSPIEVYEIGSDYKELKVLEELYLWNLTQRGKLGDVLKIKEFLIEEDKSVIRSWLEKIGINDVQDDVLECSLLGWRIELIGEKVMLVSETCGRRVLINDEVIDVIDEHHDWCCYVDGYKDLIRMMRTLINTPKKDEVTEGSVQDTLERLDKLRELYFD